MNLAWIAVAIAAICAGTLAYLVADTALDKSTPLWGKAALAVMGLVAVFAALIASDTNPFAISRFETWLRPRVVAAVLLAFFGAFGLMTDMLGLLSPRPAVETRPYAIEDGIRKLSEPRKPAPAVVAILGRWGPSGCVGAGQVAVSEDGRQLTMDFPDNRSRSEIRSASGNTISIRQITPAAGANSRYELVLEDDILHVTKIGDPGTTELVRC